MSKLGKNISRHDGCRSRFINLYSFVVAEKKYQKSGIFLSIGIIFSPYFAHLFRLTPIKTKYFDFELKDIAK